MSQKGFSLIELLIYISVLVVAIGMFSSIFTIFVRIQSREAASAEVSEQFSFVQNTIQRLVRESSNIENEAGVVSNTIILRMASTTKTIISYEDGKIYLQQNDKPEKTSLISDRVKAEQFDVIKYENPGGHAVIQLDMALSYNNPGLYQQIRRAAKTAVGRVTAATFDDNLVPGAATYSLGSVLQPWKDLYLSGTVFLGGMASNPQWAISGSNIYNLNSGSVGIGVTNPNEKLEINGGFRLNTTASKPACDANHRGSLWFTQSASKSKDTLEVCNKTASDAYEWKNLLN